MVVWLENDASGTWGKGPTLYSSKTRFQASVTQWISTDRDYTSQEE